MKYAIVEISGRQFWIETGKYYDLNRIPTELGKEITLNRVLLVNNDGELLIGKPYLESVKIKGKILEHLRSRKTIVYKMRPKKKTLLYGHYPKGGVGVRPKSKCLKT